MNTYCCTPRCQTLLVSCASSTNGNRKLVPMLPPHTIKTCWTAVTLDSRAVSWTIPWSHSQDSQEHKLLIKQYLMTPSVTKTWLRSQKSRPPGDIARKNLPQPIWRVGSTQWAGSHLHQELVIVGTPPQIGFPPHQILLHRHPKSQSSILKTQNRPEATSHQKLTTDGASPKIIPFHTVWLTTNHHELNQLAWAGDYSPPEHVITGGGESTCS